MRFFANDLGVDLGTSNVLIYVEGKGVVVREPAVVAVDKNSGKIIQVGMEAKNMLGRTPGNVVAMQPLKGGVISDHVMAVRLLQAVFRKAKSKSVFNPKPRVVICVPSGVTEVDDRTVINAAIEAGARRVYLIEEPRAAALGANLDIGGPNGHMVVDIGGGTTDIAVLSMNGVAVSSSIKVAGESFDETIARYVRKARSVVIGKDMAEDLKIRIGSVVERSDDVVLEFIGCSVNSGLPIKVKLHANEIIKEMSKLAEQIAEEVKLCFLAIAKNVLMVFWSGKKNKSKIEILYLMNFTEISINANKKL